MNTWQTVFAAIGALGVVAAGAFYIGSINASVAELREIYKSITPEVLKQRQDALSEVKKATETSVETLRAEDIVSRIYRRSSLPKGCDTGLATASCEPGDLVLGGGGSCGQCGAEGRMETSRALDGGWTVACDENGNNEYDGGIAEVICLRATR